MGFFTFLHFNFRGSALRQSHTLKLDAIKLTPLLFYTYVEIIADSVKYELTMSELRSCVVEAMICGYHEYQSIWEAEVGENLMCIREPGNVRDPYAVAVTKPESSTIVGHVPRKIYVCSFFENGLLTLQIVHFLFSMPCGLY